MLLHGLSLVLENGGCSVVVVCELLTAAASHCEALCLGAQASVLVAYGLSCSAACGIFLEGDLNPCALHWQADSYPLYNQGSPQYLFVE